MKTSAPVFPLPTDQPADPPPSPAHNSLYRRYFTPLECAMLDATPPDDLTSEINLLRILLARVLAATQQARQRTLELQANILSAFSHAGIVIASLARLQHRLHEPMSGLWQDIADGIHLARLDRRVYDYLSPPAV
jgi:hypothetical protein